MKGIAVDLVGTDRVVKSDADGLAVFDDVEADSVMVSLDSMFEWSDAVAAMKLPDASPRRMAVVAAAVGETKEVVLGAAPAGTATIDGRLVREDGSPIAGVRVSVDRDDDRKSAETDAAGNVRFADLQKGLWSAHLSVGRNMWFLAGAVELTEGGHADAKWTLGSATIRGRLVAGADRHGVLGATVWFRGANTGAAHTDADGRYELPNARVGSYSVDAKTDNASAAPRNVVVPSDGDVVVELVEFGRVVVRFLAADRAALRGAEISFIAPGTDDVVALLKPGAGDDDLVAAAVAPGRYEVELALGGRKQRFPVEVKSGETAVVEVKAP